MSTFDDEIARKIKDAADSGELRLARDYGKPIPPDTGWDATPEALRMPMKILKDAGVPPPEIAMFQERSRLREALATESAEDRRAALRKRLIELEQHIALRLEALRINARL